MIQRINFIEKGKYALTYRNMLILVGLWVLFCVFIFLVESGYGWWVSGKLALRKQALDELNYRKERAMALVEATKTKQNTTTAIKSLSEIYANYPAWSEVMMHLSNSIPAQLWLTGIGSEYLSKDSFFRRVEISGQGQSAASITQFVKQLNKAPIFHNVFLNSSKKLEEEKRLGYSFIVLGEVRFGEKQWN